MQEKKEKDSKPSLDDERELNSIETNAIDYVEVRGKMWGVRWIRNRAKLKVSTILLKEEDEMKVSTKCAAALRLNGFFAITFFYWFLWRWYFYVKQYSDAELLPFLNLCKKKVQLPEYLLAITLLTEMKNTVQAMTREEVNRFHLEHLTELRTLSQKSTANSQSHSSSSEG